MKKLLESATNLIYRIQISRLVVSNVIFTASCAEWDPIWSETDILLEFPEKRTFCGLNVLFLILITKNTLQLSKNPTTNRFLAKNRTSLCLNRKYAETNVLLSLIFLNIPINTDF